MELLLLSLLTQYFDGTLKLSIGETGLSLLVPVFNDYSMPEF